ncbi:PREDICTED: rho GTPase-activating protein 24-like [Calidris pugnax]|uniref:rho GTPase-activating protein 24-like n=1 Tax=Calidris pugnax TaxID=198806 RepID=UPI00071D06F6|nr:PREDICTED: rho GTPase-activating protein 24-like [Calidris pugnax]
MFEENSPSRHSARLTHPENSPETNTTTSPVPGDEEKTGPIPVDTSNSFGSCGGGPATPSSPQHHPAELQRLISRQKAEYESKIARHSARLTHPENSPETNTTTSPVSGDEEKTGPIPVDTSDSFGSCGGGPETPSSPQHHPAELQRLISRQKAEYESKIARLEQRNRALQAEVKATRWKLGQQRKWQGLVEMKMRNAERAREDAERRNEMLQKEMEEFFETFGEINRWK